MVGVCGDLGGCRQIQRQSLVVFLEEFLFLVGQFGLAVLVDQLLGLGEVLFHCHRDGVHLGVLGLDHIAVKAAVVVDQLHVGVGGVGDRYQIVLVQVRLSSMSLTWLVPRMPDRLRNRANRRRARKPPRIFVVIRKSVNIAWRVPRFPGQGG